MSSTRSTNEARDRRLADMTGILSKGQWRLHAFIGLLVLAVIATSVPSLPHGVEIAHRALGKLTFIAGLVFYLVWGFTYGSWNLFRPEWVGAYAVTVVLVGFGLVGMLLYRK